MATLKIPSLKLLKFARNYEKVLQKAEQQSVRAREMREAARKMCERAAQMRAEIGIMNRIGQKSYDPAR